MPRLLLGQTLLVIDILSQAIYLCLLTASTRVEREIKKQPDGGALFEFSDFVNLIKASNSKKFEVYEMQNVIFFSWQ